MQGQTSSEASVKPKFHLHNSKVEVYAQNAIKRSNVKGFVSQSLRTSERLNMQNNQNKNLSQHLLHLKNSCNDLKKDINNKENDAVKMKDETSYTHEKVKQLQVERQKLEQKISNLTKDVDLVHTKKQSTFHTYKTYEHILWRMKKDQITNQIKKNHLQKQITNMEKEMKLIENKLFSLRQYEELSVKGLRQAEEEIQKQNLQRNKKVNQMGLALEDKRVSEAKKQQRHQQTKSIQQMAAGDLQDADLIRMKKFFEVQMFLKYLLKDKMQRLKDYYEPYELAFLKIKSQTSAKDAHSLKSEFFNFESQFQQRTAWIKHLEEQISDLQKERKQLNEEWLKEKQSELDLLDEYESNKPHEQRNQEQEVQNNKEHICKRALDAEMVLMKVKEWTNFQSKRVAPSHGAQVQSNSFTSNFSKICDFLIQNKRKQTTTQTIQTLPN